MARAAPEAAVLDQDKLDQLAIDSESGRTRRLTGWQAWLAAAICAGLSLYALYWVVGIVQPLVYRASFLLIVLVLSFMFYPGSDSPRAMTRVTALDWLFAALAVVSLLWPLVDFDNFIYRAADPTTRDMTLGAICISVPLASEIVPVPAGLFVEPTDGTTRTAPEPAMMFVCTPPFI